MTPETKFIIGLILIAITFVGLHFSHRQLRFTIFALRLENLAINWNIRHAAEIEKGMEVPAQNWLDPHLPNPQRVIFSFKPLKLETWFSKEIVEKLKS